jgi:hypothetical protein
MLLREKCLYGAGSLHAGEFYVEALILIGKAVVIDAKKMKDGGLKVWYVDRIFDNV